MVPIDVHCYVVKRWYSSTSDLSRAQRIHGLYTELQDAGISMAFLRGSTRVTGWSNHHFLGGHQVFVRPSPDDFDFYDVDLTIVDKR